MKAKGPKGLWILLLLAMGLVAGAIAVRYSTEFQQHASNNFTDLNSSSEIIQTNNPDGTMGPMDSTGNFSNTLPLAYLGGLYFQVTDPSQGKRPTDTFPITKPTSSEVHPTGENVTEIPDGSGNVQSLKSLVLTITKVEVHLARLATPGQQITPPISPQSEIHGRPSGIPTFHTNQVLDRWETLDIGGTQTIDLVQLASTKGFEPLGLTKLAGGLYTEVRLYIAQARATLVDGTSVSLTLPGRANIVRIVEPFVIVSNKTTTLSMDFDAQNSVIQVGSRYLLKPVVAHFTQKNQQ